VTKPAQAALSAGVERVVGAYFKQASVHSRAFGPDADPLLATCIWP